MTIITWSTEKTAAGFVAKVSAVHHAAPMETLKTATFTSRAKAKAWAQQWVRFMKHQQRFAA